MSDTVLKIENVYKRYRLGMVDSNAFKEDLQAFWAKLRGKADPFESYITANELAHIKNKDEIKSRYVWALQDINFEVKQGEIVGIIGKNGAGKSTLLKLLSKTTAPTRGQIKVKGRIASLLEVGTGFHPELTGRENIYLNGMILGMTKREVTKYLDEIIDFAGIDAYIDTPVKRYSSGMYVRLGFAVAAHLLSDILIVDEVLAVGDAEFQKKCIGKMKDVSQGEGRTVLFVSHSMDTIKKLCPNSILMKQGQVLTQGNSEEVITKYISSYYRKILDGNIPRGFSTYNHNNLVHFTYLQTFNHNKELSSTWFCGRPFYVKIKFEVHEPLTNIILNLVFGDANDNKLIYIDSYSKTNELISLDKGSYEVMLHIEDIFLPNTYYLSIGIHDMGSGGLSLDWIENILSFQVYENTKVYVPKMNWGNIMLSSDWQVKKISE